MIQRSKLSLSLGCQRNCEGQQHGFSGKMCRLGCMFMMIPWYCCKLPVLGGEAHLEELNLLPTWCGILELGRLVLHLMAQDSVPSSHIQASLGTTGTSTIGPRAIESPITQSRNVRWYTPLPTLRSTWGKHTVHVCGSQQ